MLYAWSVLACALLARRYSAKPAHGIPSAPAHASFVCLPTECVCRFLALSHHSQQYLTACITFVSTGQEPVGHVHGQNTMLSSTGHLYIVHPCTDFLLDLLSSILSVSDDSVAARYYCSVC